MGQQFQGAAESGFEATTRSLGEANTRLQSIAEEVTDFSKKRFEDVFRSWDQLFRARSLPDVMQAQTEYAQRAYEAYSSELAKLGEMYLGSVREASSPLEETSRRLKRDRPLHANQGSSACPNREVGRRTMRLGGTRFFMER